MWSKGILLTAFGQLLPWHFWPEIQWRVLNSICWNTKNVKDNQIGSNFDGNASVDVYCVDQGYDQEQK